MSGKAKGLKLHDGTIISSSDKVITFINRTYEPYRGIHVFLQSLVDVFKTDKDVKVLLVGNDTPNVSYGAAGMMGKVGLVGINTSLAIQSTGIEFTI